jgi:hypothetical protein
MVPETGGIIQPMAEIEEETPLDALCEKCERLVTAAELQECPVCKRKYCTYCVYRLGSQNYCSRACADIYFFGGEMDGDSDDEIDE